MMMMTDIEQPKMKKVKRETRREEIPVPSSGNGNSSRSSKLDLELKVSRAGGGGFEEEGNNNPFVNDVVVSNLLEYCDKGDLGRFRLVSKLWHQISLKRFRQSATVVHDMKDRWNDHIIKVVWLPGVDGAGLESEDLPVAIEVNSGVLEKYNLTSCPNRNFKLKNWKFELNHMDESFWRECGGWIQTLTLTNCTFREGPTLDRLLEKSPNLECIIFDNVVFSYYFPTETNVAEVDEYDEDEDDEDEAEANHDPVMAPFELPVRQHPSVKSVEIGCNPTYNRLNRGLEILGPKLPYLFPNLERIRLSTTYLDDTNSGYVENFNVFVTLLTEIRKIRKEDPSKFGITNLDIVGLTSGRFHFPSRVADLLNELKFPLKSLSIHFMSLVFQHDVLTPRSILRCHSSTLTKLEIAGSLPPRYNPYGQPIEFSLDIPMNSLRELKLHTPFLRKVSSFQHFPNLRTFECTSKSHWAMKAEVLVDGDSLIPFRLPHLTTFKCPTFQPATPNNLEILAECMPNLKEIWMQANPDTFPALCSFWKNSLRKLHVAIQDKSLDDHVITGIGRTFSIARISRSKPNITDVKGLEEFEMYHIRSAKRGSKYLDQQPPRLTYLSFREGFCRLPNLRKLSLVVSPEWEKAITDNPREGVGELVSMGFDVQIVRDNHCNLCVKANYAKIM